MQNIYYIANIFLLLLQIYKQKIILQIFYKIFFRVAGAFRVRFYRYFAVFRYM